MALIALYVFSISGYLPRQMHVVGWFEWVLWLVAGIIAFTDSKEAAATTYHWCFKLTLWIIGYGIVLGGQGRLEIACLQEIEKSWPAVPWILFEGVLANLCFIPVFLVLLLLQAGWSFITGYINHAYNS